MFSMQQFVGGGIDWVPLMNLDFESWRIDLVFRVFVWNNGEDLWYMYYF